MTWLSAARWNQPGWSSSTRTAGARVSDCGSGSRKKARAGSNCRPRLSLRWLPPVERVGGADIDVFTTVRLFSQCLNVPSLFGLDGNGLFARFSGYFGQVCQSAPAADEYLMLPIAP